jgi:DNA-binding transcriptional LysR family regulator
MKLRARQIEVFQAVMEANTLTDAANRLFISQPSVSRILARFEQVAGFKAFELRGRRLVPTAAARIFYEEILRLQRGIDHLNKVAEEISNFRRGHVSIGVLPSLSSSWIAGVIDDFTRSYPDIHVSVITRSSRDIVESVESRRIDLGISLFESTCELTECQQFMAMRNVCILPRGHALCAQPFVSIADLQREKRFIALINSESSLVVSQYNLLGGKDFGAGAPLKASSAAAICHLVAAGHGVSIVSEIVAREHAHLDLQVRPLQPNREQPVYLLKSRLRAFSPLVDMLSQQIVRREKARAGAVGEDQPPRA